MTGGLQVRLLRWLIWTRHWSNRVESNRVKARHRSIVSTKTSFLDRCVIGGLDQLWLTYSQSRLERGRPIVLYVLSCTCCTTTGPSGYVHEPPDIYFGVSRDGGGWREEGASFVPECHPSLAPSKPSLSCHKPQPPLSAPRAVCLADCIQPGRTLNHLASKVITLQ